MAFQLIEINTTEQNVTCPYCHQAVLDWTQEQYIQPCEHTLFIAMDLGFEFISDAFEQSMPRSVDEIHANDEQGIHIFNEIYQATFTEYQMYKMDLGVEGLYRYIGFSPNEVI